MSQMPNQPQNYGQSSQYQDGGQYQYLLEQKGKNYAVASLVLGIAAIVLVFTGIVAIIGVACGVVGLILGNKARKILPYERRGMATAGFVCSIVGLGICAIGFVVALIFLMILGAALA